MRNALGKELAKHFSKSPFHSLFCGDIGFRIFDELRESLPKQFENFGISEQHMVSFAAAYATEIKHTSVVYTINPFITSRVHDQLRVDVAYSNAPLVVCSVGAGFAYDTLGFTHFGLEDLSLISSLPNFKIYTPSDPDDVHVTLNQIFANPQVRQPVYLRLQKGGEPDLDQEYGQSQRHDGARIWNGTDFTILVHGFLTYEALEARKQLAKKCSVKVVSVLDWSQFLARFTSEPYDIDLIIEENHYAGSLASFIYRVCSNTRKKIRLPKSKTVFDATHDGMVSRGSLLKTHGLHHENLVKDITSII